MSNDPLMDILCGTEENNQGQDFEHPTPVKQSPAHSLMPLSSPMTVPDINNTPVIVEDPIRFRKDIQTMVMAQMMEGVKTEEELAEMAKTSSAIQVATAMQLQLAACGNLKSYEYMMNRVLGRPVNQTNSVSMNVTYEQLISELDPDEKIEPKAVFCEEV